MRPPVRRHKSSPPKRLSSEQDQLHGAFPLRFASNPATCDWPLLPNVPDVAPVNNLVSVSAEAEHPNLVNPPKREVKRGWERTLMDARLALTTFGEVAYAVGFKSVAHFSNAFQPVARRSSLRVA